MNEYCYSYCLNNPLKYKDPDGQRYRDLDDWYEDENGVIKWTDYKSQKEMDDNNLKGKYLGESVVVFNGSLNEKLGTNDNLFGMGAYLAEVVVYGSTNSNDIGNYKGFTMSSDPASFGVLADGDYLVNRLNANEKRGPYGSDLIIENRNAKLPAMNDFNPAYSDRKPGYLDGVFIHRSNNDGWAGTYKMNGKLRGVSEGCLLISPNDWNSFNNQLKTENSIYLKLYRQ